MKISIQKFDPAVDPAPYTIEHEVPYTEKMTLLEVVTYVNEQCEMVAFDFSCHGRQCGRCAVMLDDMPCLLCSTPVADKDHVIKPLAGHTILRDLVVDKSEYHDRLARKYVRVRTEDVSMEEMDTYGDNPDAIKDDIWHLNLCMRCGMCDAACPSKSINPGYSGPSTMVALAFRHLDPYDQSDRVLQAVSEGLYHCISCGTCDEVCQRYEIEHLKVYDILRSEAESRGLKPSYAE